MQMQTFRVWRPEDDDGEFEPAKRKIEAVDAEAAAEEWARREDWDSAEYAIVGQRARPVVVVQAPDGTETRWRVRGEEVPTYYAEQVDP
jgi:hypothetical protein